MKLKIFKTALTAIIVIATFSSGFSQQTSPPTDTGYRGKMNDLNAKMRDLQKQMRDLQREQGKKQREEMRVQSEQMSKNIQSQVRANNYDRSYYPDKNLEEQIKNGTVKEVTKAYSKSYAINGNDRLSIENKFGKVTVITWDKNEFKVDVQIKADANDQADAQKMLDGITISDSKDASGVAFKTHMDYDSDNNGTHNHGNNVHNMVVNYTVYLPTRNELSITNSFGGTDIPNFDGKLTVNSSFGNLTAQTLSNQTNNIVSKFGSANIVSLKGGDLKVSFGSLQLQSADKLTAEISYSTVKIGTLKTSGNIAVTYAGGFKIDELDKGLKSLNISSAYSSISLGLDSNPSFDFNVSVSYGSFNYGDHTVNITSKTPVDDEHGWSPTKTYIGHLGKGNADKLITIINKYGSVKFD